MPTQLYKRRLNLEKGQQDEKIVRPWLERVKDFWIPLFALIVIPLAAVIVASVGWNITQQKNHSDERIAAKNEHIAELTLQAEQSKDQADINIAHQNAKTAYLTYQATLAKNKADATVADRNMATAIENAQTAFNTYRATVRKNNADVQIATEEARTSEAEYKETIRKNLADLETAKTNLATVFLQTYYSIPPTESDRRSELIAESAPYIDPTTVVRLAVQNLADDPIAFKTLFDLYGDATWYLLEPYLGKGPNYHNQTDDVIEYDPMPGKLLDYLSKHGLLVGINRALFGPNIPVKGESAMFTSLDAYSIVSPEAFKYSDEDWTNTVINYSHFVAGYPPYSPPVVYAIPGAGASPDPLAFDTSKLPPNKQEIVALAKAIGASGTSFDQAVPEDAVSHFWDGIDVSSGGVPINDDLRLYFYRHCLYRVPDPTTYPAISETLPERQDLENQLFARIKGIKNFNSLPWVKVHAMITAYLIGIPYYPTPSYPWVGYLNPDHSSEVMKMIFDWASTDQRAQLLGIELNSGDGEKIFDRLGAPVSLQASYTPGLRSFAISTIDLFNRHYTKKWGPAGMLDRIFEVYPELRPKLRSRDWGIRIDPPLSR